MLPVSSPQFRFLYIYNYDLNLNEICALEARQIFGKEPTNKTLTSNIEVNPSISPFIKARIELISSASDYSQLLANIKEQDIHIEDFNIEYLILQDDSAGFVERRQVAKDIGWCIEGDPNFKNPTHMFAVCKDGQNWYFGKLTKRNSDWQKHKQKPQSFSNSIDMKIGKSLVATASQGDTSRQLLDACCGVGTILLEACFASIQITGCDISQSACSYSEENLAHFGYHAPVHCTDIKDHKGNYDAVIIDLPYNLYSISTDDIAFRIIQAAATKGARLIIVSIADIKPLLIQSGLVISDFCNVEKKGGSRFKRKIWVCERA